MKQSLLSAYFIAKPQGKHYKRKAYLFDINFRTSSINTAVCCLLPSLQTHSYLLKIETMP